MSTPPIGQQNTKLTNLANQPNKTQTHNQTQTIKAATTPNKQTNQANKINKHNTNKFKIKQTNKFKVSKQQNKSNKHHPTKTTTQIQNYKHMK